MRRRQVLRWAGAAIAAGAAIGLEGRRSPAQSGGVTVRYLGHTCFLFSGGGLRILVNPFRQIGCTAGYPAPAVPSDLVMISSQLLDEGAVGAVPGNPQVLFEPGVYQFRGREIQGISMPHDREGGRRFGQNVAWLWEQGGVKILHMGGAAAPVEFEQKVLIGRPDLVLLPVGGGPKAYNPAEAKAAMEVLNGRLTVPTHYRTAAADEASCDIAPLDDFLALVEGIPVRRTNETTISLSPGNIPAEGAIQVLGAPT